MNPKAYTGIGSRENVPDDVLLLMRQLGAALARAGYVLRSGAAKGSDEAFEAGARDADGPVEIYLPSAEWRDHPSPLAAPRMPSFKDALTLASYHHPRWDDLSRFERALMARNTMQVLGAMLHQPASFLVCWAPRPVFADGGQLVDVQGGTGMAVRLAATFKIPRFHLGVPEHAARIRRFVDGSGAASQ